MTIKTWQERYNEGCLDPVDGEKSAMELISLAKQAEIDELRTAIESLTTENEAVRRANLDCVDNFNQLYEELKELRVSSLVAKSRIDMTKEIAELQAKVESLVKDAERLEWL